MLSYNELQSAYVDLYIQLRKYIWDFRTVEHIANLEIAVYRAFPDIADVSQRLNELNLDIRSILSEDEDLKSAIDAFKEVLNTDDSLYAKLNKVREVIQ